MNNKLKITLRVLASIAFIAAIVPMMVAVLLGATAEGKFKETLKETPQGIVDLYFSICFGA